MCIAIVRFPSCDVANFDQKVKKKNKYRQNEKSFRGEIKSIFHQFERAFSCQKLSYRPESVPLKNLGNNESCVILNFMVFWLDCIFFRLTFSFIDFF